MNSQRVRILDKAHYYFQAVTNSIPSLVSLRSTGGFNTITQEGSRCCRKFNMEHKGKALCLQPLWKGWIFLKIKSYIYMREWLTPLLNYPEIGEDNWSKGL